jgi:predicted phosphodiesterase
MVALVIAAAAVVVRAADEATLPARPDSVKFAVIGDNGTGEPAQYQVGEQMASARASFPFEFVLMLGDNMYGRQEPQDFIAKFEKPYAALLNRGVLFYATLGNHDDQTNRFYKPFNMGGERYFTFVKKDVRFFVLDSNLLDARQLAWIEESLKGSHERWKIGLFHHPLYSDGGRHGASPALRVLLEPLFVKYGVDVVFSGHDHIYERLKPQKGITYFVEGASGELRKGDLKRASETAAGYDQDLTFMLVEIGGDDLWFRAATRTGSTVDSGVIHRAGDDEKRGTK